MIRFEIHGETVEVANAEAANALRRALDRAMAEEREACAKLADAYRERNTGSAVERSHKVAALYIAHLIRSRGETTKQEG